MVTVLKTVTDVGLSSPPAMVRDGTSIGQLARSEGTHRDRPSSGPWRPNPFFQKPPCPVPKGLPPQSRPSGRGPLQRRSRSTVATKPSGRRHVPPRRRQWGERSTAWSGRPRSTPSWPPPVTGIARHPAPVRSGLPNRDATSRTRFVDCCNRSPSPTGLNPCVRVRPRDEFVIEHGGQPRPIRRRSTLRYRCHRHPGALFVLVAPLIRCPAAVLPLRTEGSWGSPRATPRRYEDGRRHAARRPTPRGRSGSPRRVGSGPATHAAQTPSVGHGFFRQRSFRHLGGI